MQQDQKPHQKALAAYILSKQFSNTDRTQDVEVNGKPLWVGVTTNSVYIAGEGGPLDNEKCREFLVHCISKEELEILDLQYELDQ